MAQIQLYFTSLIAIVLVSFLYETSGCFITNCPPGGKRSLMSHLPSNRFVHKECTRCGPGLSGRCFGANICCSPLTGCNIGGIAASRCALEAFNPILCKNPGPSCGPNEKGTCALNATCCTSEGCFIEPSCRLASPSESINQEMTF